VKYNFYKSLEFESNKVWPQGNKGRKYKYSNLTVEVTVIGFASRGV